MVEIRFGVKQVFGVDGGKGPEDGCESTDVIRSGHPQHPENAPREIALENLPYLSLPPSPPAWELRREKDAGLQAARCDPKNQVVFDAYRRRQYNKAVALISTIPATERCGELGDTFLKAYRNLIQQWKTKERPAVALKWSAEMIENLPDVIDDVDLRRHNKLVTELDATGKKHSFSPVEGAATKKRQDPRFLVSAGCSWQICEEIALNKQDRPDPAFEQCYVTAAGLLNVDPRGKSSSRPGSSGAIISSGRTGNNLAQASLSHDIYRLSVNPNGHAFATLSSDCGFYVYDETLTCVFSKDLRTVGTKKNYVRCVDVSPEGEHMLFTVVDTAWSVDRRGEQRWALKMPPKEGWEKVVERTSSFGTSEEVNASLQLLGLGLPLAPEDIKRRYRELALRWHPDRNQDDPLANERMQQLNRAYEVLTGEKADFERLTGERVYYKQVLHRDRVEVTEAGFGVELEISMVGPGEDWIYAAALSRDGGAFLGAYSGRIVEVDASGRPLGVIDIGSTPRQIVPNAPYLYVLSSTRLYVIESKRLLRILDIYDQANILFAQNGFGLMSAKSIRWFDCTGEERGEIRSEDPIRRIYPTATGHAVETRQHRAIVAGMPKWWRDA